MFKRMNYYSIIIFVFISCVMAGCQKKLARQDQAVQATDEAVPLVVATIAPYAYLLQQLAGESIQIMNTSEHSADPHIVNLSPQQAIQLQEATLFLSLNPQEESVIYKGLGEDTRIVEMWHGFDLLASKHHHSHDHEGHEHEDQDHEGHEHEDQDHEGHEHEDQDHEGHEHEDQDHEGHEHEDQDHEGHEHEDQDHEGHEHEDQEHEGWDEHFWLSPTALPIQIETMARELSRLLPEEQVTIDRNKEVLLERCKDLEEILVQSLPELQNGKIFSFHSALSYLADFFGAEEMYVESEGIELGSDAMLHLSEEIKELSHPVLVYSPQFQQEKAKALGEQLQLELVEFNPVEPNVFENLKDFAARLHNTLE